MNPMMQERRLASEAADWVTRLEIDESEECRNAFYAWLCESPAHIRAYLEMTELTVQLHDVKPGASADWEALRTDVSSKLLAWRGHTSGTNAAEPDRPPVAPRPRWIRPAWIAAAAIGIATCLGVVFHRSSQAHGSRTFSTDVGEQRTIKLEDGSVVTLNTRSRLVARLSKTERRIVLLDGEALFAVAHDSLRPFEVITDGLSIRALGTQFDVHRGVSGTTVSVIEGSVQVEKVSRSPISPDVAQLGAGEEARVEHNGRITKRSIPDTSAPTAWRARRLVFHETPLEDVVAEFNRYNRIQIDVQGTFGNEERLTGGFDADNWPALVRFLERDPALFVVQEENRIKVRKRPIR